MYLKHVLQTFIFTGGNIPCSSDNWVKVVYKSAPWG